MTPEQTWRVARFLKLLSDATKETRIEVVCQDDLSLHDLTDEQDFPRLGVISRFRDDTYDLICVY